MSVIPTSSNPSSLVNDRGDRNRLFIIGAGLSRTATETMCEAMEILLKQPAYHGGTVVLTGGPAEADLWHWENPEKTPDFNALFDHRADGVVYSSCFDIPGNMFVKEMMAHYPNYRVILMKRKSAEDWVGSMQSTVLPLIHRVKQFDRLTCGMVGGIKRALRFGDDFIMKRGLGFSTEEATDERLAEAYHQHLLRIRKLVPADRLIEFTANEGWEPLCKGLNLPVPSVEFPRKNERSGFMAKFGPIVVNTLVKMSGGQVLQWMVAIVLFALFFQLLI